MSRPKLYPQLTGVPTQGEDCGVSTTRRGYNFASNGKLSLSVAETRRRMGKKTGPTNPPDWAGVLSHPDTVAEFKKVGLQPPVVHLRGVNAQGFIVGAPIVTAIRALESGDLVCVAEGYLPWHNHPRFAGDKNFTDDHAVSYLGIKGIVGRRRTTRYDSLDDGRAPGIPTGPLTVPFNLAADAMAALIIHHSDGRPPSLLGDGQWAGMVVEPGKPIVVTPPPPPDDCGTKLADALDVLATARQAIADLQVQLQAISGQTSDAEQDAADAAAAIDTLLGNTDPKDAAARPTAGVVVQGGVDG